jgi:DNA-binding Xre family transcriptional regulator
MTAETVSAAIAETYAERVAAKVRGVAAERRVTGVMLARALGISPMAMSRRMTGHHALDVDELDAVARALGVTVQDLLPAAMQVTRQYPASTDATIIPFPLGRVA